MDQEVDWERAINVRRSVRSFETRAVEDSVMSKLKAFAADPHVPFDNLATVRFFKSKPESNLYNNQAMRPPDHAAFVSTTDVLSISKAGFVGEMFILYATSLGISTCWYGHYALAELQQLVPELAPSVPDPKHKWGYGKGSPPGERAICITPLGYWRQEGLRLLDRMTGTFVSHKRKPVAHALTGVVSQQRIPPEITFALDLARQAPSAANSQFWRFAVSPNLRTLSVTMPLGYRHFRWEHPSVDIGICASHIWLGLQLKGMAASVQLVEDDGRAVWRFTLDAG